MHVCVCHVCECIRSCQFKTCPNAQALDAYVLDPLYGADAAHGRLVGAYVLERAGTWSAQSSPRDWSYTVQCKKYLTLRTCAHEFTQIACNVQPVFGAFAA
jgi:hypothetical protein